MCVHAINKSNSKKIQTFPTLHNSCFRRSSRSQILPKSNAVFIWGRTARVHTQKSVWNPIPNTLVPDRPQCDCLTACVILYHLRLIEHFIPTRKNLVLISKMSFSSFYIIKHCVNLILCTLKLHKLGWGLSRYYIIFSVIIGLDFIVYWINMCKES